MRYIDQDEIELDLPDNWDQTVANAWTYVNQMVDEAEQGVIDQAAEKGWEGDVLQKKNRRG